MSLRLQLTDIIVRLASGLQQHDALTDDASVFLEVQIEDDVQRIGPLIRQSTSSWKVPEDVDIPSSTPVVKFTIILQCGPSEYIELGSIEIVGDVLLAQCQEQAGDIMQTVAGVENMPSLELAYNCCANPSEGGSRTVQRSGADMNALDEVMRRDPDLAFAILEGVFDDALLLSNEYGEKATILAVIASQLGSVCYESNKDVHLNKAISSLEVVLGLISDGHPMQIQITTSLGVLLSLRAERSSAPADFDRAVSTLELVIMARRESQMEYDGLLTILGDMHLQRFAHCGDITDIDKCISSRRDVLLLTPEDHPDKPGHLTDLGNAFVRRFERSGELSDIEQAISAHKHADDLTPEGHIDKRKHLNNLGISFLIRFKRSGELTDIEQAISAHRHAVDLTPDGHPDRPEYLNNLGISFLTSFKRSGELADIEQAISAHKHAVNLTPDGHPDRPAYLNNLGNSFLTSFKRSGELTDIEQAISANKHAIDLSPDSHTNKPAYLNILGNLLLTRCERSGELTDIEQAIFAHKHAVDLTPNGDTNKPAYLNNLGISFRTRFERSGELTDIEQAVSTHKHAVDLTSEGHANRPRYLSNLGISFRTRFERSGELTDIEQAISAHKHAVDLTPDGHPDRPEYLNNLGISFLTSFKRSGELADIEQAISAHKHAVDLTPNKPSYLISVGNSFLTRFKHSGELTDIEQAISAHKHAVDLTPEGHAKKPAYLSDLGSLFLTRFERSGELTDIEQAIFAHKHAVDLTPEGHTDKPGNLNNLGNSFLTRFRRWGELTDIEQAICAHKHTVDLTPDGHANKPVYLNNLGNSFLIRFERWGELTDIEQAISAIKHAIELTPKGDANKRDYLSSVGNSFLTRFRHSGELTDIEQAISAIKHAIDLTPEGHTNKPAYLANLGTSFLSRFERLGELTDIELAISAHKHALELIPEGDTHRPAYLNNLGSSFLTRFERRGELTDIEQAISTHKHAVDLTPDGHADKPGYLSNLGNSFYRRFDRFHEPTDLDAALEQFRSSSLASTGPPLVRYRSACTWARLLSATRSVTSFDAYSVAIGLLPRVAWLGLTIPQRHKVLAAVGDIGSEAAAAAIQLGRFDTALEWLEAARSIVWGQLLNLRKPVDELRSIRPHLADELVRISQELDNAGTRDSHSDSSNRPLPESMEHAVIRHYRLAKQWDSLVERVRGVRDFEDFLRPKKLPQLLKAAQYGPVITINVHESRCDCLALIPGHDDVIHIPLPNFSYKQSLKLRDSLHQSLLIANLGMGNVHAHKPPRTIGAGVRGVLSTLWYTVAKPVLSSLAFGVANVEDPPRIWWCPTGPLTSLPLHAAGLYGRNRPGFTVTEFVTSSYTPTLAILIERSRHSQTSFAGLLAISQPNTPGQKPLPNAAKELAHIQSLGSSDFHVDSLLGDQATVEDVVKGMTEHSWVHFACHALQDVSEPNRSAFYVHDGRLTLSRIISNSFPHADFAFLSACQTATGDEQLSEEAVHLAGAMIVAGYRSVIATMWSIIDPHAPVVVSEVYRRLDCGSSPDSSRAAHALHHAVQKLREDLGNDSESSFLSWLPFIHVGI